MEILLPIMPQTHKNEEKKFEVASKDVERADKVKFLGVLIDDRLSFKYHVSNIQNLQKNVWLREC